MSRYLLTMLALCAGSMLSTASAQDVPTSHHDDYLVVPTLTPTPTTTPLLSAKPPCPLPAPKGGCAHKPRC